MNHVILLGDSIFDNSRYVPGEPSVIEHLRRCLPERWQATLLARDGAGTTEMGRQIDQIPEDATHLVLSVGGNDALDHCGFLLREPARSFAEVLTSLAEIREEFARNYQSVITRLIRLAKPTTVCTVYDAVPGLSRVEATGLCIFNDVILREAFRARMPVIDLRLICSERGDYSKQSPIEPSAAGGRKIAATIAQIATLGFSPSRKSGTGCSTSGQCIVRSVQALA